MSDAARSALERLLPLLKPEHRDGVDLSRGYVDVLQRDLTQPGLVGDLMQTRAVSGIYERWWRPALGRVAKGLTGPGNFSRAFAGAVGGSGLVVGVDVSETMLQRGAEDLRLSGLRNLSLMRASATELPFVDSSFDAVCCFAALHLFDDPLAALDEMTRVLTPGGRIALMTSVQRQLAPRGPFRPLTERLSGMRVFTAEEIVEALQFRGFGDIHQRLSGLVQFAGATLEEVP